MENIYDGKSRDELIDEIQSLKEKLKKYSAKKSKVADKEKLFYHRFIRQAVEKNILLTSTHEGYASLDEEGKIEFFNDAFLDFFEFDGSKLLGKKICDFEFKACNITMADRLLLAKNKKEYKYEMVFKCNNEKKKIALVSIHSFNFSKEIFYFVLLRDITQNILTANELEASEMRFRNLIASLPVIVYKLDFNGNFIYINNEIKKYGYNPEDLIGRHFSVIIHPDDIEKISRSKVLPKYENKITGKEYAPKLFDDRRGGDRKTQNLKIRIVEKKTDDDSVLNDEKKFGIVTSYGEVFSSGVILDDHNKHPSHIGTLGIISDISENLKLQEQLIRSEKMSAVGQLTAGIAHEFNNILAIISGNIYISKHRIDSEKNKDELSKSFLKTIETINKTVERGKNIITNMMAFSKPQPLQMKMMKIEDSLENISKLLERQFEIDNVFIEKNFSETPEIFADNGQIEQVFLNLIINAKHAIMPKGKGWIVLSTAIRNKYIEIRITDTGIGMNENIRKKIFSPFFTTKSAMSRDNLGIQGTGLGLSISYTIIKKHGGHIEIESVEGVGTTFIISLPIPQGNTTIKEIKNKSTHKMNKIKKNTKILFVDDEPDLLDAIFNFLLVSGYENISIFTSAREALKVFYKGKYDIIFLDLKMPDISGEKMLEEIRSIDTTVTVFFLTGQIISDVDKTNNCGVSKYLQKPIDFFELCEIIEDIQKNKKQTAL